MQTDTDTYSAIYFSLLVLLALITIRLFNFRYLLISLSSASSCGILLSTAKLGKGSASWSTNSGYSFRFSATTCSCSLKKSSPLIGVPSFTGSEAGIVAWQKLEFSRTVMIAFATPLLLPVVKVLVVDLLLVCRIWFIKRKLGLVAVAARKKFDILSKLEREIFKLWRSGEVSDGWSCSDVVLPRTKIFACNIKDASLIITIE